MVFALTAMQSFAAAPVISSFQSSGSLTWTNAEPDYKYTVEWASSPTGNWVSSWGPLCILPGTNSSMTVSVPMCYRISATQLTAQEVITNIPVSSRTIYEGISSNAPQQTDFIEVYWNDHYGMDYSNGMIYAQVTVPGLSSDQMPSLSVYVQRADSSIWFQLFGQQPSLGYRSAVPHYYIDGDICNIGWRHLFTGDGSYGVTDLAAKYRVVVVR
jgi:hypothetical protein